MTTIVLDPGHGGSDPGAVNGSFYEKTFNLNIALRIRDYLQSNYDVRVVMTRTTDTTVGLRERTDLANRENADYFCSIHVNSGGGTGWESYIYNGSTVRSDAVHAQKSVHDYVMSQLRSYVVKDRGERRANFHVLRDTLMPAILVENLFIDNPRDLTLLRNSNFLDSLGNAIGEGLARALSLNRLPDHLHRVIAGSFISHENAKQRQKLLIKNGVEAIVVRTRLGGRTMYRVQAGAFREQELANVRLHMVQNLGITDAFITTG